MKKRFLAAVLALTMTAACMTSCGGENKTEDKQEATTTTTAETTTTTEKENGVIDTTTTTKVTTTKNVAGPPPSEIPQDVNPGQWHEDSEKTETTTKTVTDSSDKETKETTTTKQTTTQPAVTTKPYIAPTTTTQKPVVTTKPAVQTTKTTTKATTKSTTKQTTKTTTNNDAQLIASLNPLEKAMYNLMMGDNSSKNIEFIRQEFIKYGKSLKPNYVLDKNLYLWVDKNGKPTNNAYEAVGFTDYACSYGACGLNAMSIGTTAENIQAVKDGIYLIKRSIEDHLLSIKTDDDSSVHWYIQITRIHPTYVQNGYNCFVIFRFV